MPLEERAPKHKDDACGHNLLLPSAQGYKLSWLRRAGRLSILSDIFAV
jgi:hypothetical protein